MFVRVISAVAALVVVAVFLLPSTLAIYAAVNGTAWDLQELPCFFPLFLALSVSIFAALLSPIRRAIPLQTNLTHPVAPIPLFELDCALLC